MDSDNLWTSSDPLERNQQALNAAVPVHTNSASPVLGKRQTFFLLIYFLFTTIIPTLTFPLYADDAKCFRELLSLDDHDALQKDLYSIED